MHFRSQKKSAQDVSLSDLIETGDDGASLSLMDVVGEEDDLLETISNREQMAKVLLVCSSRMKSETLQSVFL